MSLLLAAHVPIHCRAPVFSSTKQGWEYLLHRLSRVNHKEECFKAYYMPGPLYIIPKKYLQYLTGSDMASPFIVKCR